ncbi:MAG: hypothetical protein EHM49_08485 [Deltaproteobacteria bacterium]|nr:MAG: hypothetical protein EHM49_08485 [Deltaproteobacteria bacterium]
MAYFIGRLTIISEVPFRVEYWILKLEAENRKLNRKGLIGSNFKFFWLIIKNGRIVIYKLVMYLKLKKGQVRADPWHVAESVTNYGKNQDGCQVYYVGRPFTKEPDFGMTSVIYNLSELLAKASFSC